MGEFLMLVGSYNHKLDGKGRTVLPAKFRGELGSSVVAAIGIDNCIALYPVSRWEELIQKLKNLSAFKKRARDFRRVLLSTASEQEIDGAGRILIPQLLRDYAGAVSEITLIGAEDHIEIWDTTKWEAHRAEVLQDFSDMAEELDEI